MIRPRLLEWQWSDYSAKHRDRINLLLHIVAVPLFQIATIVMVGAVVTGSGSAAGLGSLGIGAAVGIQGRGHRRERARPPPLSRPADLVSRVVAQQGVTLPPLVSSGGWARKGSRSR